MMMDDHNVLTQRFGLVDEQSSMETPTKIMGDFS